MSRKLNKSLHTHTHTLENDIRCINIPKWKGRSQYTEKLNKANSEKNNNLKLNQKKKG